MAIFTEENGISAEKQLGPFLSCWFAFYVKNYFY